MAKSSASLLSECKLPSELAGPSIYCSRPPLVVEQRTAPHRPGMLIGSGHHDERIMIDWVMSNDMDDFK